LHVLSAASRKLSKKITFPGIHLYFPEISITERVHNFIPKKRTYPLSYAQQSIDIPAKKSPDTMLLVEPSACNVASFHGQQGVLQYLRAQY
jgi:hypothetical protein